MMVVITIDVVEDEESEVTTFIVSDNGDLYDEDDNEIERFVDAEASAQERLDLYREEGIEAMIENRAQAWA